MSYILHPDMYKASTRNIHLHTPKFLFPGSTQLKHSFLLPHIPLYTPSAYFSEL